MNDRPGEPQPISEATQRILRRLDSAPVDPEREFQRVRDEEARQEAGRRQAIADRLKALVESRGERYAGCTLENYRAAEPEQNAAVAALSEFSGEFPRLQRQGEAGLILYGPRGTGKDHLLFALMRNVIQYHGQAVVWVNGMDLFGRIRDRIQRGEEERDLIRGLVKPDVLAISDPLPPFGALTEFQATMLFRVLDERYSRRRPVWVTVNVANRAEFEERMGVQLVDRLIDGALVVYCNWKSYREVRKRT
jgi:DNA replication protein DnaC